MGYAEQADNPNQWDWLIRILAICGRMRYDISSGYDSARKVNHMKVLRLIGRILLAPAVLLLTVIIFLLALLLALSTRVLAIISSLGVTLSLLLFATGDYKNGGIFLLLTWLISPIGLPLIAEWLWKGLDNIRGLMWRFVFC